VLVGAHFMRANTKPLEWPEKALVSISAYNRKTPKRYLFEAEGIGGPIWLYTKDSLESGALYAVTLTPFEGQENAATARAFVNDYLLIASPEGPSLRARIIARWRALGVRPAQLGLLANIMVGERGLISEELKKEFRHLGASHMLAISGLHIGVLYALLRTILFFLPAAYRDPLLVGCLWVYASIAGFSPSVVRATLILSLYALSKRVKRIVSTGHILVASAWISLMISPKLLFDLGFLMNYSAVGAIVLSMPLLKAFEPNQKVWRYLYYLCGVSCAAQLGVAPIALVTFKSISLWFLVGSLALLPLMPFILGAGLIALTFAAGAALGNQVLSVVLSIVHYLVQWVPSPLHVEWFTKTHALLYYSVLAVLMYFAHKSLDQRRSQQHHYP
jgi:competence protein ComEC